MTTNNTQNLPKMLQAAKDAHDAFIEAKIARTNAMIDAVEFGYSRGAIASAMGIGRGSVDYAVEGYTKYEYNKEQEGDNGWKSRKGSNPPLSRLSDG